MTDRGGRRGADRRRQRRSEDKARREGAQVWAQSRGAGAVAAEAAERFGERALDHVDAVHGAIALADAAAAWTIHSNGVHLVDISHCAVAFGQIADAVDRRDVAVHGIEALEHD